MPAGESCTTCAFPNYLPCATGFFCSICDRCGGLVAPQVSGPASPPPPPSSTNCPGGTFREAAPPRCRLVCRNALGVLVQEGMKVGWGEERHCLSSGKGGLALYSHAEPRQLPRREGAVTLGRAVSGCGNSQEGKVVEGGVPEAGGTHSSILLGGCPAGGSQRGVIPSITAHYHCHTLCDI